MFVKRWLKCGPGIRYNRLETFGIEGGFSLGVRQKNPHEKRREGAARNAAPPAVF
jgi:hypothetical protein